MQSAVRNWQSLAPENVFLVIGLVFGGLLVFVLRPFGGPDEPNHFHRAIQVSEGTILGERQGDQAGGYLPEPLREPWRGTPGDSSSQSQARVFVDFRNTVLYTPIPYLPHATALAIGRMVRLSPLALLYLARLAGLAVALAGVWLAIRTTPKAQWLFVLLALAPMSIRQMSVVSADTVTHVSALLLLAITLRLALDPEASPRGWLLAGLVVSAVVLSLSKQAYLPMLLLYFLCPAAKFGGHRRYVTVLVAIAGLCIGLQAAWFLASRDLYLSQRIAPGADPGQQISFILAHPIRYATVVLNDLWNHGAGYLAGALGYGGLVRRPIGVVHALGLVLVALAAGGKSFPLSLRAKGLLVAAGASTVAAVLTMNYLGWNAVGSTTISDVQGRYFIPVLPLGFLLVTNERFPRLSEHRTALATMVLASVSSIALVAASLR